LETNIMTHFKLGLAASALGLTASLLAQPADAATVRRHLHCATVAGGTSIQILVPVTLPGMASITNNWNTPIAAGTAITLTVAGHPPETFYLGQEVGAGASFGAGHPDITGPGQVCDATFNDTGYQTGGTTPPKKSKLNNLALPKKGIFTSN
jgi:hypothetical protein